jgi:flagellum-specific peptidoglycan hydrolase FlgJ
VIIKSLLVLLAQTSLENGVGYPHCKNYNFGNIKYSGKTDYCFYRCNEIINGKIVWFDKPNPAACFVAFETCEEGVIYYLSFIKNRYRNSPSVWNAIVAGDPVAFSHALKQNRYYTADEGQYTKGVVALFNQFNKLEYDINKVPIMSDEAKQKLQNIQELTLNELADNLDFKSNE